MICETEIATAPVASTAAPTEWDEQDVVARAKSRSSTAFDELVARYERRVFRLAQNITRNNEDAEDVVQSALLKAFQNLSAFRGDSRFYTWLVRITVNEALMKIRRSSRRNEVAIDESKETDDPWIPLQIEDCSPNPEQRCSEQERQRILAKTINDLKPGFRAVVQLRDVDGFSTEETAQALALTSSAVKSRLQRARLTLRNSLHKYFQPTGARCNQRGGSPGVSAVTVKHRNGASENQHSTIKSVGEEVCSRAATAARIHMA
jgi:RNA polymerase sigma-70 factor, ECF subfamily